MLFASSYAKFVFLARAVFLSLVIMIAHIDLKIPRPPTQGRFWELNLPTFITLLIIPFP